MWDSKNRKRPYIPASSDTMCFKVDTPPEDHKHENTQKVQQTPVSPATFKGSGKNENSVVIHSAPMPMESQGEFLILQVISGASQQYIVLLNN